MRYIASHAGDCSFKNGSPKSRGENVRPLEGAREGHDGATPKDGERTVTAPAYYLNPLKENEQ